MTESNNENSLYFDAKDEEEIVDYLVALKKTVSRKENDIFATWYGDSGKKETDFTFGELWDEAGVVAQHLCEEHGLRPGDRVVLCYNFGLHFLAVLLGCFRAGIVAALVYPPGPPLHKSLPKLNHVISDCHPKLILTDSFINMFRNVDRLNPISSTREIWPYSLPWVVTDSWYASPRKTSSSIFSSFGSSKRFKVGSFRDHSHERDSLAFIEYTSGSTGDPKGVMVTFGNLSHNAHMMQNLARTTTREEKDLDHSQNSTISRMTWLPQYHDMGLIAGLLMPLVDGWQGPVCSPISFIKNPLLWIELMSKHKVSFTIAPDFAYRLVVRKFKEAKDRGNRHPIPDLDMSSIRFMCNAAEPIRSDTHTLFQETFSEYKLPENHSMGCYGLAENTVFVCYIRGHHLSSSASPAPNLVAVGHRANFDRTLTLDIVDTKTFQSVPECQVGEIWISSPSVAKGYYGKPELSHKVFQATLVGSTELSHKKYLRTGDLGFFENDKLFICGRIKDLIIVNGVNFYPQDFENVAQDACPAIRSGRIAAFSSNDTDNDGLVVIVFEVRHEQVHQAKNVCAMVHRAVTKSVGVAPQQIVAVREKSIPLTTSGKIQRRNTRDHHNKGLLSVVWSHESSSFHRQETDATEEHSSVSDPEQPQTSTFSSDNEKVFRIIEEFVGEVEAGTTWEELGLSSITVIQLQSSLCEQLNVVLEPNVFELHTTPYLLAVHIIDLKENTLLPKKIPLHRPSCTTLPWSCMVALQAIGIVVHAFLFSLPIIPVYHVLDLAATSNTVRFVGVYGNRYVAWFFFPLAVPTWMISFSVLVILTKWVVVGKYKCQEIPVNSFAYLRWWFMDRTMHIWEHWVGQFITESFCLWAFYSLMGAKIHIQAQLKSFVREFDLIDIGQEVSIEHSIKCRAFRRWQVSNDSPQMIFRPIKVYKRAVVKGMLGPGSTIGENSLVELAATVPEGSEIPQSAVVQGNRLCAKPEDEDPRVLFTGAHWFVLEGLKLCWFVVELYTFFSFVFVARIFVSDNLPQNWRYTRLLYWVLVLAITSILNLLFGAVIKWVLIGRRRPGQSCRTSILGVFGAWAADYHFFAGSSLLISFLSDSVLWNFVLMLYGMDIDIFSKIIPNKFPPSKVDLVSVQGSFVAPSTFETVRNHEYQRTNVINSSVGYRAMIGPGITVENMVVPPLSSIAKDMTKQNSDERHRDMTFKEWIQLHVPITFFYVLFVGCFFVSLIPAFEMWVYGIKPQSIYVAVLALAAALPLTTVSFLFFMIVFQFASYPRPKQMKAPWSKPLFLVTTTVCWSAQRWSFLSLLWGTPMFAVVAKCLGANVKGQFLYFGDQLLDYPYLEIADKTILDGVNAMGHYAVFGDITLGQNQLSGLQHEGTVSFATSVSRADESGPWRVIF